MRSLEWKNKLTKHAVSCSVRCPQRIPLFVIKQGLARMERTKSHDLLQLESRANGISTESRN